MASYSEKFSAIHHEHHKSKMKKLSIGTEGFFDFFKKKNKEETKAAEPKKSIEDFVNLFNEEFGVIEKKIQESEQTEWTIDSAFIGKAKTAQELINSAKAHVIFLKEVQNAMLLVLRGIGECNAFTKEWITWTEIDHVRILPYIDKIEEYQVTPKHFRSLDVIKDTKSNAILSDKNRSFDITLETLKIGGNVAYDDIPVIDASFKFTRDSAAKITLNKDEFISFMKELKNINAQIGVLFKDYLNFKTDKFDELIQTAYVLYEEFRCGNHDEEFDDIGLARTALGVSANYHNGEYTKFCQQIVDEYIKYMHSFLKDQSKS